jgi:hypothetical protein
MEAEKGEMPDRPARYIEWQSGGRRTGRIAYVFGRRSLPPTVAGAEWQRDSLFNAAEEIVRDPTLGAVFQAAVAKGCEIVTWR